MPPSTSHQRTDAAPPTSAPAGAATDFKAGLWRLADPKITLASMASIFLGACFAAAHGPVHVGWLMATVWAYFCIEVAKNASGDVYDFDSGDDLAVAPADRTDFSGGKRVLVDGLLTRRQTWAIAAVFYASGIVTGAAIVFLREPTAFWIGTLGLLLAWSYHGPPLRFAYRGLGEVDVVLCYGPLIAISTFLIQTHTVTLDVVLASLPLGLLIGAFLWINEFPDHDADLVSGKRNQVVRLGRRRASRVLPWIQVAAFALLAALPAFGVPRGVWLGAIAILPAGWVSWQAGRDPERCYRHAPVQAMSLVTFLLLSLGAGLGVLV